MSELVGVQELRNLRAALYPRETDDYELARRMLQALVHVPGFGFYAHQWVDYHAEQADGGAGRWRMKLLHDIRLKDGRELIGAYPNGDSWQCGNEHIKDSEVTHIRISLYHMMDERP